MATSLEGLKRLEKDYQRLRRQLGKVGYLSKGSVVARPPGRPGSRYQWTTKVQARTVSLTLSSAQYAWLAKAVANQRQVEQLLQQMHRLSRQIMRLKFTDASRRKRLNRKVLHLI